MKVEILDKIAALVTVAIGLVAALAWNGAIRAIFERIFGSAEYSCHGYLCCYRYDHSSPRDYLDSSCS